MKPEKRKIRFNLLLPIFAGSQDFFRNEIEVDPLPSVFRGEDIYWSTNKAEFSIFLLAIIEEMIKRNNLNERKLILVGGDKYHFSSTLIASFSPELTKEENEEIGFQMYRAAFAENIECLQKIEYQVPYQIKVWRDLSLLLMMSRDLGVVDEPDGPNDEIQDFIDICLKAVPFDADTVVKNLRVKIPEPQASQEVTCVIPGTLLFYGCLYLHQLLVAKEDASTWQLIEWFIEPMQKCLDRDCPHPVSYFTGDNLHG